MHPGGYFCFVYMTLESTLKTLIESTQGPLRINDKLVGRKVSVLDGWEVRSYIVIPSLCKSWKFSRLGICDVYMNLST
jgi:hypothetical protein